MRVIEPKIFIQPYNGLDIMKNIERAMRVCYRSEGMVTEDSYNRLLKTAIDGGHESVLEHEKISVLMTCSINTYKDLTRHRAGSAFSIECISGDTIVNNDSMTVQELYNNIKSAKLDKNKIKLRSVNEFNEIIENSIEDVWYKGKQPVYLIELERGYTLKCTKNHLIRLFSGEYRTLTELKIGDEVSVNGRLSLVPITDTELKKLYNTYTSKEIANMYNIPITSVRRKLHQLNIFQNCKNVPKEAYNKNHTKSSYEKMRNTILKQYEDGREPWNKGLTWQENKGVARQRDSLIEHHWSPSKGEECPSYRCGISLYRSYKSNIDYCELCGITEDKEKLEVHHIDKNRDNNELSNLIKLCITCHHTMHKHYTKCLYRQGIRIQRSKILSIKYLGEEDTYDIQMKSPYDNFLANGIVVHNSTRWNNYSKGKFGNELTFINPKYIDDEFKYSIWKNCMQSIEDYYMDMAKVKAKPDELRTMLPHSIASEVYMTCNIREWRHILKLRTNNRVHPEIRQLLIPLLLKFKKDMPVLFEDIEYDTDFQKEWYADIEVRDLKELDSEE